MICELQVRIAHREGKSYLKDAYVTTPFRIVPVGQYKRDNAAYLMIMSSSPGLLDGDEHRIDINLDSHTKLQLQTQAYQRLFQMNGHASQITKVLMGEGSVFSYIPHPIVPQQASSYLSHTIIDLKKDCHLLLSDIITCGRKLIGELFEYTQFQNLTECTINGKLVVKDNILLQPKHMPLDGIGFLEGYTHQGTLIYLNSTGLDPKELIDYLYEKHHDIPNGVLGISALQNDGFMIRVLDNGAERIFKLFKEIESYLWDTIFIPHTTELKTDH